MGLVFPDIKNRTRQKEITMAKLDKEFLLSAGLNVDDHGGIINKILNRHNDVKGDLERQTEADSKTISKLNTEIATVKGELKTALVNKKTLICSPEGIAIRSGISTIKLDAPE